VRLQVGGGVQIMDDALLARVDVSNQGDTPAEALRVHGELLLAFDEVGLDTPLAPNETRSVALRFPLSAAPPGVHLLGLRLDYTPRGQTATSQRAYLLVALGETLPAAVRIDLTDTELRDRALVRARLSSLDGQAHRVLLRVLTPRGLNPHGDPLEVSVPAQGATIAHLPILRGGVPRPSTQGVLVSAATLESGAPTRTAVATGVVHVLPDPARLPGLRRPLALIALGLVVATVIAEIRRARRA
jgi:hypothetical protein